MATEREALGQPASDPDGIPPEADPDFAAEHENTTVSKRITSGEDDDREPESPDGLGGLDPAPGTRPD